MVVDKTAETQDGNIVFTIDEKNGMIGNDSLALGRMNLYVAYRARQI